MNTRPHAYQASVITSIAYDRAEKHYRDIDSSACGQDAAALTLLSDGIIDTCNQAAGKLFGCLPNDMTGQHITWLLPQVAKAKQFKGKRTISFLRFLSHISHRFDVVRMNGTHFPAELVFSEMENTGRNYMQVFILPVKQKRHDLK